MRLHHVTVTQDPDKFELVDFFYSQILRLPAQPGVGPNTLRWFEDPVYLVAQKAPEGAEPHSWGGFTGIQLNVVPADDLNPIVANLRAIGLKQPEPHAVGDCRVMTVHDPSGNHIMLVGTDEMPVEPCVDEAVGSVSVFVSDIDKAREFFVEALVLPVRAEPHQGLIVIGEEEGTALMLYQAPEDNPNTPVGRNTGLAFTDDKVEQVLAAVVRGGGTVVHQSPDPGETETVLAATFADPDGNQFVVLSRRHLAGDRPSQGLDPLFD